MSVKTYTTKEVRILVLKAWHAGGKDCSMKTYDGPTQFIKDNGLEETNIKNQ